MLAALLEWWEGERDGGEGARGKGKEKWNVLFRRRRRAGNDAQRVGGGTIDGHEGGSQEGRAA